ncbi:hypothetical protein Prudu_022609 [Prunus dulcis]|uniref:Uncharacterized protein n=1 Tax=Prunus dulcis TaxID=3755 RepID=A0A4Y1S033_PRUDU|nr:hypothetical protein Prudu_022609 [Prunus dulcis]
MQGICSGPCKMKWYVLFDYLNPQCLNGHWELDGLKTEERSLDMLQPASKGSETAVFDLRLIIQSVYSRSLDSDKTRWFENWGVKRPMIS